MIEFSLSKGKRGTVSLSTWKGKPCVIKRKHPGVASAVIAKEAAFLALLNKYGIGPKLYAHDEARVLMEYVDGVPIGKIDLHEKPWVIRSVLRQCRVMDTLGINKFEMTNPHKHIIVKGRRAVLIDFERCIHAPRPKNVTQFCEFLRRRGYAADATLLRAYKQTYDERVFKQLLLPYKKTSRLAR